MKYFITILLLLGLFFQSNAQDFDLYKKDKNDNYKLPEIYPEMTYVEFELLSQNIRMKDMLYAGIVPGYVHFNINEKKTGYWLLGIRSATYITMGALYYGGKYKLSNTNFENLSEEDNQTRKNYQNTFYTALAISTATYLYDVIHGDSVLHKKQEKIRYKYAIKANKNPISQYGNDLYPSLAFTIQF